MPRAHFDNALGFEVSDEIVKIFRIASSEHTILIAIFQLIIGCHGDGAKLVRISELFQKSELTLGV